MESSTPNPIAQAPMIDATKIRSRSKTRIVGMDRLDNPPDTEGEYANMTDAERQMREEELSFYSASDNDHGDDNIWGLLSGVGGNIYEWYELIVLYCIVLYCIVLYCIVLCCDLFEEGIMFCS